MSDHTYQTSRRDFLRAVGTAAIGRRLATAREQPNVLFIAIDDLNDWIGCLGGHPDARTPNLDRLASRGVMFTNAHCPAPLCNPSRAAVLTGYRPTTSGVYRNDQPMRKSAKLRDAITLPHYFRQNGYRSQGGGKIFHGSPPDPQSWDEYFPSPKRARPADPLPPNPPLNGIADTAHFDWGPIDVPDSEMGDSKVVSWAAGELARPQAKPFFTACGIFRPHLPWYVPRKYFDLYPVDRITLPNVKDDDLGDVPPIGREFANANDDHRKVLEHNQWRKAVQGYLASISFADACVGRVLDALDNSTHAANTIIVLWSDHGWHLGEKLHWRKFALWEEATHNVLMVVAPGVTGVGLRCDRTVNLMDIYPTLIELCGLPARKGLEGVSLVPLLRDPRREWNRPAVTTYLRNNHSVRSERWRYIRYRDGTEELYDHRTDELEWYNLAGKPECAAVKADLARWLPRQNAMDAPREKKSTEAQG